MNNVTLKLELIKIKQMIEEILKGLDAEEIRLRCLK